MVCSLGDGTNCNLEIKEKGKSKQEHKFRFTLFVCLFWKDEFLIKIKKRGFLYEFILS